MKNFIKILFTLSVLLTSISCNKRHNEFLVRDYNFDIGFNYLSKNSGTFINNSNRQQYIYFADLVTKKCIKIFDLNARLVQSIAIQKEVYDYLHQIDGISIIGPDTIILNALYTNKICLINSKGISWHKINLQGKVYDSLGNVYEITKSVQATRQHANSFFFGLNYTHNINDTADNKYSTNRERTLAYYKRSTSSAYFLKIENPLSAPKLKFCLYKFQLEVAGPGTAPVEFENLYVGERIFTLSNYSPYIYQIDTSNFRIKTKHLIQSQYTPLNFAPYNLTKNANTPLQDYITQNSRHRGKIFKVLEGCKDNILVFIYHDIKTDMPYRPTSLIVYNNDFQKLREIPFINNDYNTGTAITTRNGILIRKSDKMNKNETTVFSLFNFN